MSKLVVAEGFWKAVCLYENNQTPKAIFEMRSDIY